MTVLLLAAGIWAWPTAPAPPASAARARVRARWARPGSVVILGAVSAGSGSLAALSSGSSLVGLSAALLGGTLSGLIRSVVRSRRKLNDRAAVGAAVNALIREVAAGADLDSAVAAVRRDSGAVAGDLLGRLQMRSADGGGPSPPDADGTELALIAAVRLSRRVGAPLAVLLTGIAEGLADEQRAVDQRSSTVAGARLSGWVLALLPLMGVLLGTGMGANPIPVLFGGGPGSVLLLVGTALLCMGLLWSGRIAR